MTDKEIEAYVDWVEGPAIQKTRYDAWLERASRDQSVELAKLIEESIAAYAIRDTDRGNLYAKKYKALAAQILRDAE